jgi:hypothetical protein
LGKLRGLFKGAKPPKGGGGSGMLRLVDAIQMSDDMKNPRERSDIEIVQEEGDALFNFAMARFGPVGIVGALAKIATQEIAIPIIEENTSYFDLAAEEGKRVEAALTWIGVEDQAIKTKAGSVAAGVATAAPAATLVRAALFAIW